MAQLWGGRFTKETDKLVYNFNASISFDKKFYKQDMRGSMAHVKMLAKQGILTEEERDAILAGIEGILADVESGKLEITDEYEDIHSFVEAVLIDRIGDPGKKLHTGRSRNDQVALDMKLYTRDEIAKHLGISNGGSLTTVLEALIASDFVIKYVPFGFSKRQVHYKLVDSFCLFYLKFVDGHDSLTENFWLQNLASQPIVSWRGLAFENLCFTHVPLIKKALGISGVKTTQSAWSKRADDTEGTQVDLLISRMDNIVNLCEIKFYGDMFSVDSDYYKTLIRRQALLAPFLKRGMGIRNTLITTYGLSYNKYSGIFANVITLDDLFAE